MRVTIDATSALLRSAGIKAYTYYWVQHLRKLARPGEDIRAFPYLEDFGRLEHEASTLSRSATLPRLALLYGVNLGGAAVLDAVLRGSHIFHGSNQVRLAPRKTLLTATVHDLTCFLMPELHTPANVRADKAFADQVLKRADGLIAVSENTRQDAINILGIPPERITTIYSGVPEQYFTAPPTRRARPYVLSVGTIEPRKNLDGLLDAWKLMRPELRDAYDLVVAGPAGWGTESTLARIKEEAVYLGYVPEEKMPGLFAGATAFVYPSLYEGFGFPVVQAMASGVPVVTSNTSCLPEVAGGGALLVDPKSPREIANALEQLLESEEQRQRIGRIGQKRAQRYRWVICAAQSLDFFRAVAGR
jgi:glycosyltransferase involved in cell wall biosynthesis